MMMKFDNKSDNNIDDNDKTMKMTMMMTTMILMITSRANKTQYLYTMQINTGHQNSEADTQDISG
jgi:hypothetical protein